MAPMTPGFPEDTNELRRELFAVAARMGELKQELARRGRAQVARQNAEFAEVIGKVSRGEWDRELMYEGRTVPFNVRADLVAKLPPRAELCPSPKSKLRWPPQGWKRTLLCVAATLAGAMFVVALRRLGVR